MLGTLRYWVLQPGAVLSERYHLDETLHTRPGYVSYIATDLRLQEKVQVNLFDPS